jgi:hypothetical protein
MAQQVVEQVRKLLSEHYACFVIIACSTPSKEGKMDVEMSYEGDEDLAAFLIDNASQVFDDRLSAAETSP